MRAIKPAVGEGIKQIVGRFAPSPSGRMHLGNLFSCLLSWLSARAEGGRMILRMEDLDPQRTSRAKGQQLMADLRLLGLDWDEGPYWQSERSAYYQQCLKRLIAQNVVYPCFCSRAELHAANAPHASDGDYIYSGRCRGLTAEQIEEKQRHRPPALRLAVAGEEAFIDRHYGPQHYSLSRDCGDFILRRSDGVYAYQLAVVVDDAMMGVNQVVRGGDLLSSTPRQLWLQERLELPRPEYGHLPLLLAPDGRRLAKRDRDQELGQLREQYAAPELVGRLAFAACLIDRPDPITPRELLPLFSWEKLPREDLVWM